MYGLQPLHGLVKLLYKINNQHGNLVLTTVFPQPLQIKFG